jgi:uncharacterized protein YdhG (YjbR/CyaY superfamily)
MSFQAYINNIKTNTGKSPEDFKKLAQKKGLLKEGFKASDLIKWLKEDFDLGHGHSMAIWATFKMNGWVTEKATDKKIISKEAIDKKAGSKQKTINGKELVDKYIAGFPKATQALLEKMRSTIKKAAPKAEETIGYGIPTFKLNGNLVHYAGYQNHIGFYPGAGGIAGFQEEISKYKNAKGSVQFPVDKPLPLALVTKITKFRVNQNEAKAKK